MVYPLDFVQQEKLKKSCKRYVLIQIYFENLNIAIYLL